MNREVNDLRNEVFRLITELDQASKAKFASSRKTRKPMDAVILVAEHRAYDFCVQKLRDIMALDVLN